jgi:hypothetical protein
LELLVVIAVIGLLVAITLPAVQSAREAARRIQCLSNIRQIAIGCGSYSSTHRCYPPSGGIEHASFQVRLLPYIEQSALAERFDLSRPINEQIALARLRPAILSCPSDPVVTAGTRHASYCGNGGWSILAAGDPVLSEFTGVMWFLGLEPVLGPEHVTDGLSNTAIVSEFRPGTGDDRRRVWSENVSSQPANHRPVEVIAADCLGATSSSLFAHGLCWATSGIRTTIYDHVLAPNSRSCDHAITARSIHPSDGVHVGFCDGSARFVTAQVDVRIWRAYGTRKGEEVVHFP